MSYVIESARYTGIALALKALSTNPAIYRKLGNLVGNVRRSQGELPRSYHSRILRLLDWCGRHETVKDGDRILELGTGWMHAEALVLRYLYDVEVCASDVWDNRQLDGFKHYAKLLAELLPELVDISSKRQREIQYIRNEIIRSDSFDELYPRINFKYHLDSTGKMLDLPDQSFDFVFSNAVMEHVRADCVHPLLESCRRVMKVGGKSFHVIDMGDHLGYAAKTKSISAKNYLRFSEREWNFLFGNSVQYINRIQTPEWYKISESVGLTLLEDYQGHCDVSGLPIADAYTQYSSLELSCKTLVVMHVRN